jgi:predicted ATPase
LADAEVRQLKATLAAEIIKTIDKMNVLTGPNSSGKSTVAKL